MQLEFSWRDHHCLARDLEEQLGIPVELTLTDNTSSMLTARRDSEIGRIRIRVHRMFLTAPPRVVSALAKWVSRHRCRKSAKILDDFLASNQHLVTTPPHRRVVVRTRGGCHNLRELMDKLNTEHFANTVRSDITWGRMPSGRRSRRSIRFGSFSEEENLIRVHPLLDQSFVPRYFVRYIVFHEMLHAHMGVSRTPTGRRRMHSPEFRRIEKAYPDYQRAIEWMDKKGNLSKLLRATR